MSEAVDRLKHFIEYVARLKGDEKGEAQVFCDRLFQAFGLDPVDIFRKADTMSTHGETRRHGERRRSFTDEFKARRGPAGPRRGQDGRARSPATWT